MQPDPGTHVVVIGLKDIYDQLLRLTATVDVLVAHHGEHTKDLADHEARLRQLERSRWPLPAVAVLVSLGALAVAVVSIVQRLG